MNQNNCKMPMARYSMIKTSVEGEEGGHAEEVMKEIEFILTRHTET
jgi:hypothetical protein